MYIIERGMRFLAVWLSDLVYSPTLTIRVIDLAEMDELTSKVWYLHRARQSTENRDL